MAKMLGAFVCVDLYFFACDLLTSGYFGGEGQEVVATLTTGPLAPFFWTQIVGCAICAMICFTPKLRTNPLLVVGSLLAIVGIFCKRVQILVGGFQIANLTMPGPVTDMSATFADGTVSYGSIYSSLVYWPTPIEFGVTLGVIALAVLLMLVGWRRLPLKPPSKDLQEPAEG